MANLLRYNKSERPMRWGWLGLGISVLGLFILIEISMNVDALKASWQYTGLTVDIIAGMTGIGILMAVIGHRNWKNR